MWWLLLSLKDYGFLLLSAGPLSLQPSKAFGNPLIFQSDLELPKTLARSLITACDTFVTDQVISGPGTGFRDWSQLIPVKKNLVSLTQTCCISGPHITLALEPAGLLFWSPALLVNVSPCRLRSWSCPLRPRISGWAASTGTRPGMTTWSANASHWASPTQQPSGGWPPS